MISIGDLAQSFQLRRDNARLSTELNRLASELSSGRVSDLTARVGGDFSALSSIEREIVRIGSFETTMSEARLETTSRQSVVSSIRTLGTESAGPLILVSPDSDTALIDNATQNASERLSSLLGLLNTQVAGRSLFSGIAVTAPAVADKETILAALESEVALANAATPSDVVAVVDAWFAPGGGFESLGYLGDMTPLAPIRLSDSQFLNETPKADDPRLREAMAAFSIAALVDRGLLAGDNQGRASLARTSGERLLSADRSLVDLQAAMGEQEAQIARAQIEVSIQSDAMELARSELLSVDPFETATELESVETQLRTLYSVTAKLSRLTLTDYL